MSRLIPHKWNVLYLHTHDTGRVISPYGYGVPTPNYARVFADSLQFQQAFAVAPTCSPSRAALLTGCYPHQNGMLGLAQRGFRLRPELHLVHHLNKEGYRTVLCGVQHEVAYYLDHEIGARVLGYQEDLTEDPQPYAEHELVQWDEKNAGQVCRWLRNEAKQRKKGGAPFFLSFGQHATHREYPREVDPSLPLPQMVPPMPVPNRELGREDFARFATSLEVADRNLGQVYDCLRETGLLEETVLLLTTDHGLANPLSKATLFDRGIGVLFALRVPGSSANGGSYDGLFSHLDVYPTLCDLLGLQKPAHLEGRSYAGLFAGEAPSPRREVYAEMTFHTSYEPIRAIRTERYKYIRYGDPGFLRMNLSNTDRSPLKSYYLEQGLRERKKPEEALYDLLYDPAEAHNLVGSPEHQAILLDLRARLEEEMKRTEDPLLEGEIPLSPSWKVNRKEAEEARSKDPADYISPGDPKRKSYERR